MTLYYERRQKPCLQIKADDGNMLTTFDPDHVNDDPEDDIDRAAQELLRAYRVVRDTYPTMVRVVMNFK